jgi:hypothetical protein
VVAKPAEYDDEHHRFALANLDTLRPDDAESDKRGLVVVDHVAYTDASLEDLFGNDEELKKHGIEPYWCVRVHERTNSSSFSMWYLSAARRAAR